MGEREIMGWREKKIKFFFLKKKKPIGQPQTV
jgi:hypothetical protein